MRDDTHAALMSAAEALLFVSDEPVSSAKLAAVLDVLPTQMDEALVMLAAEYEDEDRGIQLREVAGGWHLVTHPAHHEVLERYILSWDTRKLSAAALEALAVVAYYQPVTRAGVNAIRGVNSDGVMSSLVEKGLVREAGRDASAGGAILYRTTRKFLEHFGLKSISELPPLEDFAPDEDSRAYIIQRLSNASQRLGGVFGDEGVGDDDVSDEGVSDEDAQALSSIVEQAITDKVGEPDLL